MEVRSARDASIFVYVDLQGRLTEIDDDDDDGKTGRTKAVLSPMQARQAVSCNMVFMTVGMRSKDRCRCLSTRRNKNV